MLVGRMICEKCGKDCTGGLWAFILGRRTSLNQLQQIQLGEFKKEFGKEQMVWCWSCIAKLFGAIPVTEQTKPESPTPKEEKKSKEKAPVEIK